MLAALADEQASIWAKHDGTESERQVPATVTVSERHIAVSQIAEMPSPNRAFALTDRPLAMSQPFRQSGFEQSRVNPISPLALFSGVLHVAHFMDYADSNEVPSNLTR